MFTNKWIVSFLKGEVKFMEKNILVAFVLNLVFSVFELVGSVFTGSVAIASDAIHDLGDACSIGLSYLLEKKSKRKPDARYTYGYARYSILGGFITTAILLLGSVLVFYGAACRLMQPKPIDYDSMILFAVVGVCINLIAALFTRDGSSINLRAVNLHMLEDVLGWAVVLVGAVVMRFTDLAWIDPLLSMGVSVFIFMNAAKNLKGIFSLFLEEIPGGVDLETVRQHLQQIPGVLDIHHIHIWSLDGQNHSATMHVIADGDHHAVKTAVREALKAFRIVHATLELETQGEVCTGQCFSAETGKKTGCHHHHHH